MTFIICTVIFILGLTAPTSYQQKSVFREAILNECADDGQVLCTGPTAQRCCTPQLNAQYFDEDFYQQNEQVHQQNYDDNNPTSEKYIGGDASLDFIAIVTSGGIFGAILMILLFCCLCPCCMLAKCMRRRSAGTVHGPAGGYDMNQHQPRVVVMQGNVNSNDVSRQTITSYNANLSS